MSAIEPNGAALAWFVAFWAVCCLGFFQLAGMYPLSSRRPRGQIVLTIGATALWLLMLGGTCLFAYAQLRLTSAVVAAGLLFLFIPELFQALPASWRDGRSGVLVTSALLCCSLAVLAGIGATPIASLFLQSA